MRVKCPEFRKEERRKGDRSCSVQCSMSQKSKKPDFATELKERNQELF